MKDDYLYLFMDRGMDLTFIEDKATKKGEKLHMGLGYSLSSPETISDEICVTDYMHVSLEETHVQGEHEKCLVMQVTYGSSDMELDCTELFSHL